MVSTAFFPRRGALHFIYSTLYQSYVWWQPLCSQKRVLYPVYHVYVYKSLSIMLGGECTVPGRGVLYPVNHFRHPLPSSVLGVATALFPEEDFFLSVGHFRIHLSVHWCCTDHLQEGAGSEVQFSNSICLEFNSNRIAGGWRANYTVLVFVGFRHTSFAETLDICMCRNSVDSPALKSLTRLETIRLIYRAIWFNWPEAGYILYEEPHTNTGTHTHWP